MKEEVIVVTPLDAAPGFALGGARTLIVDDEQAASALASALESAAEQAGIVLVHHRVWGRLEPRLAEAWGARTDVLVMALPSDDGTAGTDHLAALHGLLARAVGYEISFTPEGGNS